MGNALETGMLEAPADGKVSWTAHADLAEAAAIILSKEGLYDGPTPPLTGTQSLDLGDLAGIASELLKKPIRRQIQADEDLRSQLAARGAPVRAASVLLGLYRASRAGEFAAVDPTLTRLLGRTPLTMRELISRQVGG